jgi:hypothetical protein
MYRGGCMGWITRFSGHQLREKLVVEELRKQKQGNIRKNLSNKNTDYFP